MKQTNRDLRLRLLQRFLFVKKKILFSLNNLQESLLLNLNNLQESLLLKDPLNVLSFFSSLLY